MRRSEIAKRKDDKALAKALADPNAPESRFGSAWADPDRPARAISGDPRGERVGADGLPIVGFGRRVRAQLARFVLTSLRTPTQLVAEAAASPAAVHSFLRPSPFRHLAHVTARPALQRTVAARARRTGEQRQL